MSPSVRKPAVPHVLELLKIIEGALGRDPSKVVAYTEQLASKLEADGNAQVACRIRKQLQQSSGALHAQRLSPFKALPVDGESRLALIDEWTQEGVEPRPVLAPDAATAVDEFLHFVKGNDTLADHGLGVSPSLLAHGPPGCGKTHLGRFIAAQLGLPLLVARMDAIVSSYLGSTAKNLRAVFEHAMSRPCVLFLDEFDAVAKLRDDRHELGELKRVVVSLLQNIDSLDNKTVLIAATNHEHLLDSAVWRRFAVKVRVALPGDQERALLFQRFLPPNTSQGEIELPSKLSAGLTGADIRQVCEDSRRQAILLGRSAVSAAEIFKRLVSRKIPELMMPDTPIAERVRQARSIDPGLITYRLLAEAFEVSLGYVSKVLNDGTDHEEK
jgi:hypothetical protein